MQKSIEKTKERAVGLDVLRIMLALLIFAYHSNMHFDCHYGILEHFVRYGAIAMTAFFILSGYALNFGYKEFSNLSSYKGFLLKRFVGIFPIYYFVIICGLLIFGRYSLKDILFLMPFEILGLQAAFSSVKDLANNGGIWFISCLTICYMVYPFLQWIFKWMTNKQRTITIAIFAFILVLAPLTQNNFDLISIYDNPLFRLLEFSIGILLAKIDSDVSHEHLYFRIISNKMTLLVVCVTLVIGVSAFDIYMQSIGRYRDYMLCNIVCLPCFILMFPALAVLKCRCLANSMIFLYCCKLSYAFFLAQEFTWPISYKVLVLANNNSNVMHILVSFLCCTLIAIVLHEFVEKISSKYLTKKLFAK